MLILLLVFSDEAIFTLDGTVNRQNSRYISRNSESAVDDGGHTQFTEKINVWLGIVGNRILGPYFTQGTLTLLYTNVDGFVILLIVCDFSTRSTAIRGYLNFSWTLDWTTRDNEWPAGLPDLTSLDYYIWDYLKSKIHFNRSVNTKTLKKRTQNEFSSSISTAISTASSSIPSITAITFGNYNAYSCMYMS